MPEFLARFPLEQCDTVAISRPEGLALILKHMHPIIAASARSSGHALYHFDRMTDVIPGQGMVSRSLSSQPLLFDPSHFMLDRNLAPTNRLADVAMDDISNLSTAATLHQAEFYHGQPPFEDGRIASLVSWAPPNVGMSHAFESRFSYRYPRGDAQLDAEAWRGADAALDDTGRGVMVVHAASQIWSHARAAHCRRAADLLAVAIWRRELHRFLRVERDFTAFLPVDEAFLDWHGADGILRDEQADALRKLVLEHVVARRLYLKQGDCLLSENARPSAGWRQGQCETLSGRKLAIWRGVLRDTGPCVVDVQARIGFGAVYRIDGLLDSIQ